MRLVLKMKDLIQKHSSLEKLISQDLPIKLAFKYVNLIGEFEKQLQVFENCKKQIFEKYNLKSETNLKEFSETDNFKLFESDMKELMDISVDLGEIELISLSILNDNIKLSIKDSFLLKEFFTN